MNVKLMPAIAVLVLMVPCIGVVEAREPGSTKWTLAVGEEAWGLTLAPDGTVYVSTTYKLHAVSPDGKKKWATDLGGPDQHNPPSIGTDDTVYVSESGGSLHAILPNGKVKWRYDHPGKGSNVIAQKLAAMLGPCAIGSDGTLYLKSMDCTVHAVGTDGKKKWSLRCGMLGTEVPCLASDGTLYVVGNENEHYEHGVHALDADGKMRWFAKVDRYVDGAPAVGSDGTVYVVSSTDESTGKLFAISRDGKNRWEFKTGGGKGEPLRHKCSPSIGPDGTIYTGTAQKAGGQPGILYAVKPDGTEKWHFATKGQNAGPATIGKDGNVYFCSDNILYALTADGAKKWEFKTDGKFTLSPVIAPDGTIYVVSDKGTLYAVESNSKGLADSPWPMEGHDPERTGRATGAKTDLKEPNPREDYTPLSVMHILNKDKGFVLPEFQERVSRLQQTVETKGHAETIVFPGLFSYSMDVVKAKLGKEDRFTEEAIPGLESGVTHQAIKGYYLWYGRVGLMFMIIADGEGKPTTALSGLQYIPKKARP